MPDIAIGSTTSTYIAPPAEAKITLEGPGAGKNGILFTQANLPPELMKLKALIVELAKPSTTRSQETKEDDNATGGPSDADLNMLLGEIDQLVSNLKYKTAKTKVGMTDYQRDEIRKKVKEAAEAITAKLAEAVKAAGESTTLGWITAIAMTAVAVLLCVATVIGGVLSGGAGFAAIAGCVVAVTLAVQMITDMSLKEAGVKYTAVTGEEKQLDVSMNGMVDAIVDQQIVDGTIILTNDEGQRVNYEGKVIAEPAGGRKSTALVFTQDELADWKMGWSIAATLITALSPWGATKVAGLLLKVGAEVGKVADVGAKAAKTIAMWGKIERGAEILSNVALVTGSVTAITKGVIDVFIAELNADTDRARADKAFFEVEAQDASRAWDFAMDFLRSTVTQYLENSQGRTKNVGDRGRIGADFARAIKA